MLLTLQLPLTLQNSYQLTSIINTFRILLTGQGFIFKCISLHDWQKFWELQFLNCSKMHFWNSSALGMILSLTPHLEQTPSKFNQENLSPIYHEKLSEKHPSIIYEGDTMPLLQRKIVWGCYAPSVFVRKYRLKLANILNLAKKIVWQNRSVGWSII